MTDTPTGSAPDDGSFRPPASIPTEQTVKPAGLIERLEAAEVGSRELDYAVYLALRPFDTQEEWAASYAGDPEGYWFWISQTPATQSLDAALALAERVMPGWDWQISKGFGEPALVAIQPHHLAFGPEVQATTPALALCAAILRATGEPR